MVKILILGGDGFCGWPTALRLSMRNHEVLIVDNLSRRGIDDELNTRPLGPIASIQDRIRCWEEETKRTISFVHMDLSTHYAEFLSLLRTFQPDTIVHFAEQRSAPYSMKSSAHRVYTVRNNTSVTHNVLAAIAESKLPIHLVHLGTMGVYGYDTCDGTIPEGYLNVRVQDKRDQWVDQSILYPTKPGSIYHMTKSIDQLMFQFYHQNDRIKVTDLHQGIVWGWETQETRMHATLSNRFDYDGEYGTVLNRFIVQACSGNPLTVYGTGGQTRAFIHIENSIDCIQHAVENPPADECARVRIINQMTECHRVRDLANLVATIVPNTVCTMMQNPRKEAAENNLVVSNEYIKTSTIAPVYLDGAAIRQICEKCYQYPVNKRQIPSTAVW
jgi:UDP-sulfoquinovose synthase